MIQMCGSVAIKEDRATTLSSLGVVSLFSVDYPNWNLGVMPPSSTSKHCLNSNKCVWVCVCECLSFIQEIIIAYLASFPNVTEIEIHDVYDPFSLVTDSYWVLISVPGAALGLLHFMLCLHKQGNIGTIIIPILQMSWMRLTFLIT